MSASSHTQAASATGAAALIHTLMECGINCGFGIPSIHNIALYEALRQQPRFRHWVVRHEQAAGFAADGFYRTSGKPAVVFASTGPGNLFTLVPLLESLQTETPVILVGTNVASPLLGKTCGALHETPQQLQILAPLTRFATRITSAGEIPAAVREAVRSRGPAFIEVPHDLLLSPLGLSSEVPVATDWQTSKPSEDDLAQAISQIARSRKPVLVAGSGVSSATAVAALRKLAERIQSPVLTTTSGKGVFADDHPLAMGCISRMGAAQEVLLESDLLISIGARFTEFDTGRYTLKAPSQHLCLSAGQPAGFPFPADVNVSGSLAEIMQQLADAIEPRQGWFAVDKARVGEREKLESLNSDAYAALQLLRNALNRDDVVVNDQSILNYWASAFFPVLAPHTFHYPTGSGTLGYGLPAAIGAACALQQQGSTRCVICVAGDGGFQYTSHELATLAQYNLPVKILLVNDNSYGIIGFLQRAAFGQTHEVTLKNPDFCGLAEAYKIPAQRVTDLEGLRQQLPVWLNSAGPALLEWRTELKAPWEVGAIHRPANLSASRSQSES
jgi:thiamine pyrophosphate-dependent acetolactate synthase large subunit-like protein